MANSEKNQVVIHIEGERAAQFHSLLADIYDTVISLAASTKSFPRLTVSHGEMHPTFTVEGFAKALGDKIDKAMDMASGDDLRQVGKGADHAQG